MIGVEGNYILQFSVTGHKRLKDFIEENDLITFKLIEEAGNLLPIYELIFYTNDEEIFQVLHEGNDLDCLMGKGKNEAISCKLTVTKSTSSRSGTDKRLIHITGIYSVM